MKISNDITIQCNPKLELLRIQRCIYKISFNQIPIWFKTLKAFYKFICSYICRIHSKILQKSSVSLHNFYILWTFSTNLIEKLLCQNIGNMNDLHWGEHNREYCVFLKCITTAITNQPKPLNIMFPVVSTYQLPLTTNG